MYKIENLQAELVELRQQLTKPVEQEAVYQVRDDDMFWFDVDKETYDQIKDSHKRTLYTHPSTDKDAVDVEPAKDDNEFARELSQYLFDTKENWITLRLDGYHVHRDDLYICVKWFLDTQK